MRIDAKFLAAFFAALAEEAAAGFALFGVMEAEWRQARAAVAARRSDSRAAAALDLVAASPIVSAKALASTLGMAVNNATHLLEGLVAENLIVEVTGRQRRRLYGLPHVAGLRQAIARPRQPVPGRGRGRPPRVTGGDEAPNGVRPELWAEPSPPLARKTFDVPRHLEPLPPPDFDFSELDRFLHQAEAASARSRAVLEEFGKKPR
jgi:ribosomal protein S25